MQLQLTPHSTDRHNAKAGREIARSLRSGDTFRLSEAATTQMDIIGSNPV